ncbi:hypothetical protein J6590_107299, partial [Homalodisca vitripennis]
TSFEIREILSELERSDCDEQESDHDETFFFYHFNQLICYLCPSGIVKKIKPMTRRAFAKEICVELTTPHIQGRQKLPNLSRNLKRNIEDVVGPSTSEAQSVIEEAGTRKICAVCPAKKRRMTRFQCTKCYKHICLEHRGMLCVKCSNKD